MGHYCHPSHSYTFTSSTSLTPQHEILIPKDIQAKLAKFKKTKFLFTVPMRSLRIATIGKVNQEASCGIAITGKYAWSLFQLSARLLRDAHEQIDRVLERPLAIIEEPKKQRNMN
jgi:hypothetical protein